MLDGIFRTFRFREFWKCSAVEVWKFFRKKQNFWTREIFEKKFGKKIRNLSSEKVWILFENVCKVQKFWKKFIKFEFLSQKTLFLGQKVWKFWKKFGKSLEKVRKKFGKSSEKFGKSLESLETGFSECSEISEIVLFRNFQKLLKNDVNSNFGNREKLVPTRKFG